MRTDVELLRSYAETGSEEAFAELVRCRLDLVYSAAMRQLKGDAHLAQDVAQTVFADLARKAGSLSRRQSLTGWLYTSTRFAAVKAVRTESRRRAHEQKAYSMNELLRAQAAEPDWTTLAPVLDDAMHELDESGREVLLLRYFENRRLGEVGKLLGVSEDGARKRIERATDRLRVLLLRRGISTSTALGTVISMNALQSAPANLAASLATSSLAEAASAAGVKLAFWNFMAISKTKLGIAVLVAACMTIPLAVQHRTQAKMRDEIHALRQQLESAAPTPSVTDAPARQTEPAVAAISPNELKELIKLRGEVGALRRHVQESQPPNRQSASNSGGLASRGFVALGELAFAGYGTPEAALESALWSEHQTNVASYLASLVPDVQQPEQARLQTQFEKGISQPFFHAGNFVTGFQILETNAISEDQVALTFFIGGQGGTMKLLTTKVGSEWKLSHGPTF
jgi:RNA polymerase sigma factor (sigma-70 family)